MSIEKKLVELEKRVSAIEQKRAHAQTVEWSQGLMAADLLRKTIPPDSLVRAKPPAILTYEQWATKFNKEQTAKYGNTLATRFFWEDLNRRMHLISNKSPCDKDGLGLYHFDQTDINVSYVRDSYHDYIEKYKKDYPPTPQISAAEPAKFWTRDKIKIAHQLLFPFAVRTFNNWKQLGRAVRSGETSNALAAGGAKGFTVQQTVLADAEQAIMYLEDQIKIGKLLQELREGELLCQ